MVMSLAPPCIVQPTARTRTLNDENKNGFTDSFNRQCLPPHRYPSFSSPAPSDSAASPRQPQTSDAHHARHAGIPPTAEATSEDRRRSGCDSDSTRTSSRYLRRRPRLAVGANREAGLAVGVGGETLTGATAGTGTADSGSDSGGGEVKAGLGGTSSSSGGRRFESRPYRNIRISRRGRGYWDGGSQWRRRRCRRRLLYFQW